MSDNPALLDFLRHQLDGDEARAQQFKQATLHVAYYDGAGLAYHQRFNADRVLRQVEADRRILDVWEREDRSRNVHAEGEARAWLMDEVVAAMALRYDDHPDYREEWRPT